MFNIICKVCGSILPVNKPYVIISQSSIITLISWIAHLSSQWQMYFRLPYHCRHILGETWAIDEKKIICNMCIFRVSRPDHTLDLSSIAQHSLKIAHQNHGIVAERSTTSQSPAFGSMWCPRIPTHTHIIVWPTWLTVWLFNWRKKSTFHDRTSGTFWIHLNVIFFLVVVIFEVFYHLIFCFSYHIKP